MTNDIVKVDQLTVENTEHYTVLKLLHKLFYPLFDLLMCRILRLLQTIN